MNNTNDDFHNSSRPRHEQIPNRQHPSRRPATSTRPDSPPANIEDLLAATRGYPPSTAFVAADSIRMGIRTADIPARIDLGQTLYSVPPTCQNFPSESYNHRVYPTASSSRAFANPQAETPRPAVPTTVEELSDFIDTLRARNAVVAERLGYGALRRPQAGDGVDGVGTRSAHASVAAESMTTFTPGDVSQRLPVTPQQQNSLTPFARTVSTRKALHTPAFESIISPNMKTLPQESHPPEPQILESKQTPVSMDSDQWFPNPPSLSSDFPPQPEDFDFAANPSYPELLDFSNLPPLDSFTEAEQTTDLRGRVDFWTAEGERERGMVADVVREMWQQGW